ncbi:hypothetical protein N7475_010052 [Penicillium sp. IBT 31633x]|nr:hypothetical protein N7475_010052 [Penicillium sp. IBT 31633x]
MASNDTAAKENADDMMEKNISPLASDSLSLPQKEQVQRSSSPEFDPKVGENRLRPAGDIINRITWDTAFDCGNYIIGFVDRFEGRLEIAMDGWKKETTDEEFIPLHRVLYIRHVDGQIVWDRRRRIDQIFWSGNSAFKELAFLA